MLISLQRDCYVNNQCSENTTNIQPTMMKTFLEDSLLGSVKEEARRTLKHSECDISAVESCDEDLDDLNKWVAEKWFIKQDEAWRHIKPCEDVARKKFEILKQLKTEDILMMDLKISLYITTTNSDVRLKPFPREIVEESPEGLQALMWLNSLIPPLKVFKNSLRWSTAGKTDDNVVNLIHWLIVQLRQPKLINVPRANHDSVFQRVEYAINVQLPTFIVKVMVNNLSSNHLQWQAARGRQTTKYAFYATKVDQIHSLVHLGLYPFQKVVGPLGNGIYLTSDLQTCLECSPASWVWGKSAIGTQLQIVAVVEFIASHPKVVRYRDGKLYPSGKPYHYFVPNNSLMQVRYLLVFVKDSHQMESKTFNILTKRKFRQEMLQLGFLIGGYLMLCCVAWKCLKGSSSSSIWYIIIEKMKGNTFMAPLTLFLQPIKEIP